MKIFFSHNDRKDKVSGATEREEKDEKKEGEKEIMFLNIPRRACGVSVVIVRVVRLK